VSRRWSTRSATCSRRNSLRQSTATPRGSAWSIVLVARSLRPPSTLVGTLQSPIASISTGARAPRRPARRKDGLTRPYDQAVDRRAKFDADKELRKQPIKAGDTVLSHGNVCVLKSIGGDPAAYDESGPPCVLTFSKGDVTDDREYVCMYV